MARSVIEPAFKRHVIYIGYTPSLNDNIIGMLEKAVNDGVFLSNIPFIGTIVPSGSGFICGYMYALYMADSSPKWYGVVHVVYADTSLSGVYKCQESVWTKQS